MARWFSDIPRRQATIVAVVTASVLLMGVISAVVTTDRTHEPGRIVDVSQPVTVELGEMFVQPSVIKWERGVPLHLIVRNLGSVDHDLKLDGRIGTRMLAPGESETIELGPFESDAEVWCTVPGHKEAGMTLDIRVSTGAGSVDNHRAENSATIDPNKSPPSEWNARNPRLPAAEPAKSHPLTLTASETVLEVAPGVHSEMWTFNGSAPGPTLRGKVGDEFILTLRNEGKMAHSIDFHASKVAWSDEMRSIKPGESLEYRFVAKHSGAFMYHCGTAPTLQHIANGMYGAIVIDPPDLAPVDDEFIFVQSEFYPGPKDKSGNFAKMKDAEWDAVVFNGYHKQYVHAPIDVQPGKRIRAWVVDAGPNENSAFHVVGTVFDTVFKEGGYALRPGAGSGGSSALDLQPSQGGFVEFTFDESGKYPFVTHKFANTEIGAAGMFVAGK